MKTEEEKQKLRDYMRRWYAAHKEHSRLAHHLSYMRHRERRIVAVKLYQERHKSEIQQYMRTYHLLHKEEGRELANARWHRYRRGVDTVTAPLITLTALAIRDGHKCGICGSVVAPSQRASIDHTVEISEGGEHNWGNVQYTHLSCNQRKAAEHLTRNDKGQFVSKQYVNFV